MKLLGYNLEIKKNNVLAKTDKKPAKRVNPKIIQIAQGFKDSSRKDIDKWRQALLLMQNPEEPKYDVYHDLIDDLLTDGHLQSQIQMRKMSTLNTPFHAYKKSTKETNDELTDLLNQQWFYNLLDNYIEQILKGYTVINFLEFTESNIRIQTIPRRNVIPTQTKIIPDLEKPESIDYSNDFFKKWILEIGDKKDIGLLNNIIPNLIWLKNVFQSWAEFCEKFGLPLITATTNTTDNTTIENVHKMLLEIGEASVGTFPQGTVIAFHEASRTDAYNTFLQFIKTNQDVISKQLVGSTMLSDQGTSRSQTEVHERSLDNKIALADKRGISFMVNDQLFPLLKLHGYDITDDDRFEFKKIKEEIKMLDLWKITSGLLKSGHDIQTDWLESTFNIPIEGKKKSLVNIPKGITNNLKHDGNCCKPLPLTAKGKEIQLLLKKLTSSLISNVYNKKDIKGIIGKIMVAEGLEFLEGLRSNFKASSPYLGTDLLTLQMMEYNIFEFTASKTEARLASMNDLLIDSETKELRSFNKFKELAEKEVEVFNTSYLLTEYNLTVSTAQNSANYIRFLSEKDTVTSLVEYQTVGDDKVRNSHAVLDGKIFDLNDNEAMDLLPPNGYGCRCEFIQYLGDKPPTSGNTAKQLLVNSDPKYKKSKFDVNRANLKQVFTKKQFYNSNKTTEEIVNTLDYKDFGEKPYSSFKSSLKDVKIDQTITKSNVKELFKNNSKNKTQEFMGFKDYLDRKMIIKKSVFDKSAKNKAKAQLFPHIQKTLNAPDEVWYNSNGNGTFKSKYVSFFRDKILVIESEIDKKQGLEIVDWYYKTNDKDLRTGLKIK